MGAPAGGRRSSSRQRADRKPEQTADRTPEQNLALGFCMAQADALPPQLSLAEGARLFETGFCELQPIGHGSYGRVYAARRRTDGAAVALKIVSPPSGELLRAAQEEAARQLLLRHDHVLCCYDAFRLQPDGVASQVPRLCCVLELCDHDLVHYLQNGGCSDPDALLRLAVGICSGLRYLHSKRIAHRDLKSANILLRHAVVKLGDLGSAQATVGTPGYQAPEIVGALRDAPSCVLACDPVRADRWALGIVLGELGTGQVVKKNAEGEVAALSKRDCAALAVAAGARCPPLQPVIAALLRHAPGRRMRLAAALHSLSIDAEESDSGSEGASSEDEEERVQKITAVQDFAKLLRHVNPQMRRVGAAAVGKMGDDVSAVFHLDSLVRLLRDDVPAVRLAAAIALGQVGTSADRACIELVALLRATPEDDLLRLAAAKALGLIDNVTAREKDRWDVQQQEHIEPIIDALVATVCDDSAPGVRTEAMRALHSIVCGAWRLSSAHKEALQDYITPETAARADGAIRRASDELLYPLLMEAGAGCGSDTWPLTRSTRSANTACGFGVLTL